MSQSVSRAFLQVSDPAQQVAARKIRQIMATHAEVQDLIRIGPYVKGTSPQVDKVLELMPAVNAFVQQGLSDRMSFAETKTLMQRVAAAWPC